MIIAMISSQMLLLLIVCFLQQLGLGVPVLCLHFVKVRVLGRLRLRRLS